MSIRALGLFAPQLPFAILAKTACARLVPHECYRSPSPWAHEERVTEAAFGDEAG
jgi:hypothetical protein